MNLVWHHIKSTISGNRRLCCIGRIGVFIYVRWSKIYDFGLGFENRFSPGVTNFFACTWENRFSAQVLWLHFGCTVIKYRKVGEKYVDWI